MSVSDPIADMLTRIRNAVMMGHTNVALPNSKIKVAIVTTARTDDEARQLLDMLGMPFRKDGS